MMRRFATPLLAAALALLAGGCAASHEVARDFTVMNQSDLFELHYGTIETFSNRQTFRWTHTGTRARIRQASSIVDGEAVIEIRDPTGLLVHSKNLREQGTYVSLDGKPGVWRIQVVLDRATGSVTLEVRKGS